MVMAEMISSSATTMAKTLLIAIPMEDSSLGLQILAEIQMESWPKRPGQSVILEDGRLCIV